MIHRIGCALLFGLLSHGATAQPSDEESDTQMRLLFGLMQAGLDYCPGLKEVPGMRDIFTEAVTDEAKQQEVVAAKTNALAVLATTTLDANGLVEETCAGLAKQFSPGTLMPLFMTR